MSQTTTPSATPRWIGLSKTSQSRLYWAFCAVGFFLVAQQLQVTVRDVGYLFGWMIGASKSPIAAAVSPLVFGLLGIVVFTSMKQLLSAGETYATIRKFASASDIPDEQIKRLCREAGSQLLLRIIFAFAMLLSTQWFLFNARVGIHKGQDAKANPYEAKP